MTTEEHLEKLEHELTGAKRGNRWLVACVVLAVVGSAHGAAPAPAGQLATQPASAPASQAAGPARETGPSRENCTYLGKPRTPQWFDTMWRQHRTDFLFVAATAHGGDPVDKAGEWVDVGLKIATMPKLGNEKGRTISHDFYHCPDDAKVIQALGGGGCLVSYLDKRSRLRASWPQAVIHVQNAPNVNWPPGFTLPPSIILHHKGDYQGVASHERYRSLEVFTGPTREQFAQILVQGVVLHYYAKEPIFSPHRVEPSSLDLFEEDGRFYQVIRKDVP